MGDNDCIFCEVYYDEDSRFPCSNCPVSSYCVDPIKLWDTLYRGLTKTATWGEWLICASHILYTISFLNDYK